MNWSDFFDMIIAVCNILLVYLTYHQNNKPRD